MGRKVTQIHWTATSAAFEFGCDVGVLTRAIKAMGAEPAFDDGKFSTVQICQALFGDLEAEKIRETRHKANLLEMEEAERRGSLIAVDKVMSWADRAMGAIKDNIMASTLLAEEKNDLLKILQGAVLGVNTSEKGGASV